MNPILYMVNGFRYGILGVSDVPIGMAFGMLFLFVIIGFGFSMYLLTKAAKLRS